MVLTVAMEEFLRFVLGRLVEHPEEVVITASEQERRVLVRVEMRKSEVGKLIGRNGLVIQAVRHLLNAAAARHGKHAVLEVVE
jgi:predicted RNA-binding protein YlqC (UPF0109 family)